MKCDEDRPSCKRCVKVGRPCEGYAFKPGSGHNEPVKFVVYAPYNTSTLTLSDQPDLDWSERRALGFFQARTAFELAGAFQTDFWLANILPLARQENSVKHALVALSSMHEQFSGVDHFAPTKSVDFALSHYGKAIREIVRLKQSQLDQTFDSALVTCALFSAFESLQGHYHEACNHAISGIKILAEEQQSTVRARQVRIPREELTRFFLAMSRQIVELGDPIFQGSRPELRRATSNIPDQFTSYEHALQHMEILLLDIFDYAERMDAFVEAGAIPEDIGLKLMTEIHAIKMHFTRWQTAFDTLSSSDISNPSSTSTPESSTSSSPGGISHRNPACLILKVYRALMTAFLVRVERCDDNCLNDFVPDLWTALDAAEEFIQGTSSFVTPVQTPTPTQASTPTSAPVPAPPAVFQGDPALSSSTHPRRPTEEGKQKEQIIRPTFSLALGIVPTLFLIASSTSDGPVRDKALGLLRACNRREGFWDSRLASKLCERIWGFKAAAAERTSMGVGVAVDTGMGVDTGMDVDWMPGGRAEGVPSGGGGNVEFKLLDLKFLQGRKCLLRYRFERRGPMGERVVLEQGFDEVEWEA